MTKLGPVVAVPVRLRRSFDQFRGRRSPAGRDSEHGRAVELTADSGVAVRRPVTDSEARVTAG